MLIIQPGLLKVDEQVIPVLVYDIQCFIFYHTKLRLWSCKSWSKIYIPAWIRKALQKNTHSFSTVDFETIVTGNLRKYTKYID
jgi:hypothetical protein